MIGRTPWIIIASIATVAGCTSFGAEELEALRCTADADCSGGAVCVEGYCVTAVGGDVMQPGDGTITRDGSATSDPDVTSDAATAGDSTEPPGDTMSTVTTSDGTDLDATAPGDQTVPPDVADVADAADVLMPPASAPELIWPASGTPTGSVHASSSLRPTFEWSAGAVPGTFEIQLSDGCVPGEIQTCTFPNALTETTTSTIFQWPAVLPVSMTSPVGARYAWRVRMCNEAGCGPWSGVRYVEVGRMWSDFDGDGYGDVVVGEPATTCANGDESCFRIMWHYGSPAFAFDRQVGPLSATASSYPGLALDFGGDLNGDGYGDVVYGDQGDSLDTGGVSGMLGGPNFDFLGGGSGSTDERLGIGITGAFDIDHDGYGNIVASSANAPNGGDPRQVAINLFDGNDANQNLRDGGSVLLGTGPAPMGVRLPVGAGQFTDDGLIWVAVGVPFANDGEGAVYTRRAQGAQSAGALTLPAGTGWGHALVTAWADGDRLHDIVVGAPESAGGAGRIAIVFSTGTRPTATLDGPIAGGRFGHALARGDLDGDGDHEIIVGAPEANAGAGAVYVVDVDAAGSASIVDTIDGGADDRLGAAVAAIDVDGDGDDDVVAGAPSSTGRGAVHIYEVTDGQPAATPTATIAPPEPEFDDYGNRIAR